MTKINPTHHETLRDHEKDLRLHSMVTASIKLHNYSFTNAHILYSLFITMHLSKNGFETKLQQCPYRKIIGILLLSCRELS